MGSMSRPCKVSPQIGQKLLPPTKDIFPGSRQITTIKKEKKEAPNKNINTNNKVSKKYNIRSPGLKVMSQYKLLQATAVQTSSSL